MGVPKFFRFMSERYPCLSQLVQEFEIPEIDNLYLDMNGIIHVCSHPNDFDPHFRITEQDIFTAIFNYIEFLFKTIKPQKLFFMAVDGVAPRAKMNQQRGRRFRSAKEAEVLEELAKQKGERLPDTARFDSNCITPGTVFMDRLQQQLRYFVVDKTSNDPLWRDCAVVLSGHETPGEGEHKIMDYIRFLKTCPDYDTNMRHCLYGLDADLIMLGLCTHDPQFCLLREEIKYNSGKKSQQRISTPEETKFYLLHLSLMRDYIASEFQDLKETLPFDFDLEKIIDDWILMGFLVGNDFIPHLPDLHINKGALEVLYKAYKKVLPTLDGYLNDNGYLNLKRFQTYLNEVANFDMDRFEELQAFNDYVEGKRAEQKANGNEDCNGQKGFRAQELQKLIDETAMEFEDRESESDSDADDMIKEFNRHKKIYYQSKLKLKVDEAAMRGQAEGYVRALQWNLHYYYHGCQSWSWFYPHHYSPYVSDIINFESMDMTFDMGTPFLPFHQLLAVLPPASKTLLPEAYQGLMTSDESPIIDFYPQEFISDLNGKLQDWEAVVLIPFIEEDRLLEAIDNCKDNLTDDEIRRNKHGPMELYKYTKENLGTYKSDVFADITENHASVTKIWREEIILSLDQVELGLRPGYTEDLYIMGFPSLRFIPHIAEMLKDGVKVFNFSSREESVIITVTGDVETEAGEVADQLIGHVVLVDWPHMVHAKVVAVADSKCRYTRLTDGSLKARELRDMELAQFNNASKSLLSNYREKRGIRLGEDVPVVVYACRMDGRRINVCADGSVQVENVWREREESFALITTLKSLKTRPPTKKVPKTIEELYPVNDKVIMLSHPNYGAVGQIMDNTSLRKNGLLRVRVEIASDPNINVEELLSMSENYLTASAVCRKMSLNQGVFARITGCCYLKRENKNSLNIGLNLKSNKKNEETPGYTKKEGTTWLYSEKTTRLVDMYCDKFPEVISYLSSHDTMEFTLADLYGKGKGEGKDQEIGEWLKTLPHNDVKPVKWGSKVMSSRAIQSLEARLDLDHHTPHPTPYPLIDVKPAHVYKSEMFSGNVSGVAATHQLMDRVVCCRSSYSVPFGLRGYIVGIHESVFDILFDSAFSNGISLLGCSIRRGYRLPGNAFVNISSEHRKRPLVELKRVDADICTSHSWRDRESPRRQNFAPTQPSAFAFVNKSNSPYPGPPPVEHVTTTSNQRFQKLWEEMAKTTAPPANSQRTEAEDPSAMLMKVLNIGHSNSMPASKSTQRHPGVPSISNDQAVQSLLQTLQGKHEKRQSEPEPEPPHTEAGQSYCTQLLGHFARLGQGTPKYDTARGGGALMAQVMLPTGGVFWSLPHPTKQAAQEHAALQALKYLKLVTDEPCPVNTRVAPHIPPLMMNNGAHHPTAEAQRHRRPTKSSYVPPKLRDQQLPMPPTNWRTDYHPTNSSKAVGASSVPASLVPMQALTQQRVTRGMGPQRTPAPPPSQPSAHPAAKPLSPTTNNTAASVISPKERPKIVANFNVTRRT